MLRSSNSKIDDQTVHFKVSLCFFENLRWEFADVSKVLSTHHPPRRDVVSDHHVKTSLWLVHNLTIKEIFSLSVCVGRMLRYGPMQVCICLRSASCWTECPDRCCCCWRPMTCWGASKPPYRPEPPPRPSSTCPAAAYVPWPGQRAYSSPCHSRGLYCSLLVPFVFLSFVLN